MKVRWTALICCAVILFVPIVAEAKSIIKIGNDVTLEEGQQADMILVVGGQVTVYGLVEKNVVAVGGSIILASRAVVYGDVICVGGVISRGSGADVYGDLMEINASSLAASISSILQGDMEGWSLMLHVISLCFFAIILIIALILTLLIPRSLALVAHAIEQHKIKSFVWGWLVTLAIVPFFMLLAISIIGIFLMPLAFTALLLASIVGFIAVGAILGNLVMVSIFRGYKKSLLKETMVGVSLLWLAGWIPYLGMVIKVVAITTGMGGVFLVLSKRRIAH
jgi:hypothetical protein